MKIPIVRNQDIAEAARSMVMERLPLARTDESSTLEAFLTAYIEAALWASCLPPFDMCPQCGKGAQVLDRWDCNNELVCRACSDREPNHLPPADQSYGPEDIAEDTLAQIREDCAAFRRDNADDLTASTLTLEEQGHDFWLTRERHGAGYWDRKHISDEADAALDRLTEAAHAYGGYNLYVGDDGKIYHQ